MRLDTVHDIQAAYRRVVHATSFPGTVVDISEQASLVDIESHLPDPMIVLAMMLVDAEVTFYIASSDARADATVISQLTYARVATSEEAGYLFLARSGNASIASLIEAARIGSLTDPHLGATIIVEVSSLEALVSEHPGCIVLSGPGVREIAYLAIPEIDWVEPRRRQNEEYPLGVDLMLVTPAGQLASIPRTTRLEVL